MFLQEYDLAKDEDLHQNVYNHIAHVSSGVRFGEGRKLAPERV